MIPAGPGSKFLMMVVVLDQASDRLRSGLTHRACALSIGLFAWRELRVRFGVHDLVTSKKSGCAAATTGTSESTWRR